MSQIAENFRQVERFVQKACDCARRDRSDISLIAVSKMQEDDKINAALASGCRIFGENRVQEAQARWQKRKAEFVGLKLHLIGPLQTNKVKEAVQFFDSIHVVDRESLVDALTREMQKQGKYPSCFIQVNTGDEIQKAGVAIEALPDLLRYARGAGLKVEGLTCVPPVDAPSALHFALLKKLAGRHGLDKLSMGMSHDYERAIKLGATHIRVGTALFGSR